jgi:hypothetical protein
MFSYPVTDPRIQRRLWFTLHVLLYCSVALAQVIVWPAHPLLLTAQSALLVTLSLHLYVLYCAALETNTPQPVPARVQPNEPQRVENRDLDENFWYRWHDV